MEQKTLPMRETCTQLLWDEAYLCHQFVKRVFDEAKQENRCSEATMAMAARLMRASAETVTAMNQLQGIRQEIIVRRGA